MRIKDFEFWDHYINGMAKQKRVEPAIKRNKLVNCLHCDREFQASAWGSICSPKCVKMRGKIRKKLEEEFLRHRQERTLAKELSDLKIERLYKEVQVLRSELYLREDLFKEDQIEKTRIECSQNVVGFDTICN